MSSCRRAMAITRAPSSSPAMVDRMARAWSDCDETRRGESRRLVCCVGRLQRKQLHTRWKARQAMSHLAGFATGDHVEKRAGEQAGCKRSNALLLQTARQGHDSAGVGRASGLPRAPRAPRATAGRGLEPRVWKIGCWKRRRHLQQCLVGVSGRHSNSSVTAAATASRSVRWSCLSQASHGTGRTGQRSDGEPALAHYRCFECAPERRWRMEDGRTGL